MIVNTTQAADRDSLRAAVILGLVGPGLLFIGLLGQYLLWAARTLLNLLPGGMLHG